MDILRLVAIVMTGCTLLAMGVVLGQPTAGPGERERLEKLFKAGNFKDAYDGYRALALDAKNKSDTIRTDFERAIHCLVQLGRIDEVDAFREAVIALHQDNWRLLEAAAASCLDDTQHFGTMIAGKFHRGGNRGGGRSVGSYERDRSRSLQLLTQGLELVRTEPNRAATCEFYLTFARVLMGRREAGNSWRLQSLTPLDVLADYDEARHGDPFAPIDFSRKTQTGAPVQPDGSPVYYSVPARFQVAKNDGERWRWALARAAEADPGQLNTARVELAGFLLSQFGTETLAEWNSGNSSAGDLQAADPYALARLTDEETVARLATGIKRFKLPDEFNPIKIYQAIADDPKTGLGEEALGSLASIFENRRQFDRAVQYFERSRVLYGDKDNSSKRLRVEQILGAWGEFGSGTTQPAGRGATADFRFRNGRQCPL